MNVHDLRGCAPVPLAHYLKALGILRLVSEQADPGARGWWEGEHFRLATVLDRPALERFFLEQYRPTPILDPWNKDSGFYKPGDPGLTPVAQSTAERFHPLREGIAASRSLLDRLTAADEAVRRITAETKVKGLSAAEKARLKGSVEYKKRLAEAKRTFASLKSGVIPRFRRSWRGQSREWLDAAMVLDEHGEPKYQALLGTGGNDGRLDFPNNLLRRLGDTFDLQSADGAPRGEAGDWLRGALWAEPIPGCQTGSAVGQFSPGAAGGANSSNGTSGDSLLNPFDYILMLEGTILFTAHATRRLGSTDSARVAAPFVVGASAAGYASSSEQDESARGEQWMPLWTSPLTLGELRQLLSEGRAQLGRKSAGEPLDLARAVARLGTARGIVAFERFGYIERNGQANLAVALGRFRVPEQSAPELACLDDLDVWLRRLRREARAKTAPARLRLVERRLADALFALVQHPAEPGRWQTVLLALADVEGVQVTGSGYGAGPVPRLRPEWVSAANDDSAELRLALACALQYGLPRGARKRPDPVRRHWLPLQQERFATTGTGGQTRLERRAECVLLGRSGLQDACALVLRRQIEAAQQGDRHLPLVAARGAAAHPSDLAALVAGEVDLDRTLALARALMALDAARWATCPLPLARPRARRVPDDAWLAIRLATLPWSLPDGRDPGGDPAILRRLVAGDATAAVELALRRLAGAGIHATVRTAAASSETAARWAAALAFPIHRDTAVAFLHRLDPHQEASR